MRLLFQRPCIPGMQFSWKVTPPPGGGINGYNGPPRNERLYEELTALTRTPDPTSPVSILPESKSHFEGLVKGCSVGLRGYADELTQSMTSYAESIAACAGLAKNASLTAPSQNVAFLDSARELLTDGSAARLRLQQYCGYRTKVRGMRRFGQRFWLAHLVTDLLAQHPAANPSVLNASLAFDNSLALFASTRERSNTLDVQVNAALQALKLSTSPHSFLAAGTFDAIPTFV